jgi:hypothetical protein
MFEWLNQIQTMNDDKIKCEQTLKVIILYGAWSKPQQRWCLNQPLNPTSIKYERQVKFNEIHQTKCFYHNYNECQNMKVPTSKTITL